jgi:UMF1 family MFS transporter
MSKVAKTPRQKIRGTFSWALWDWAQQPYPTLMQTFIFPVYLASAVATMDQQPDVQLGLATTIAGLVLALTAPVIGRRSDEAGRRKFWLMLNTYVLVIITALSFFIEPKPEFFIFGLILYGLGSFVQETAFINYYAMLSSVSTPKTIGRISGYAWGLGYAGGIFLLLIALIGFVLPDVAWFGIPQDDALPVRSVFLFAAVWIAVFSIPMMLRVPETKRKASYQKLSLVAAYAQTIREIKTLRKQAPETFKFLISSAIYRDGLAGVFTFGAVLGTLAFGFDQTSIIFFGIAGNVVAGLGAAIGGRLDDILGSRTIIIASLIGLIIAGTAVFVFADAGQITYWIGGLILCLFVGPAQASSRTFVSRFAPAGREGEVFGMYQLTGRAVSFLSGLMWSASISLSFVFGVTSNNTVWGIWGLMLILIVGLFLLLRVNPKPAVAEII